MDLDGFIENFEEAIEDLEPGSVRADTRFRELGEWDSLAVLTVTAMIDCEYGVSVRADDFKNCEELGELFALVRERSKG